MVTRIYSINWKMAGFDTNLNYRTFNPDMDPTSVGVWNAVKKKLKRMCGTFKHQLPSYLDEFNWQRVYLGERFQMMLQHIAELYPVH